MTRQMKIKRAKLAIGCSFWIDMNLAVSPLDVSPPATNRVIERGRGRPSAPRNKILKFVTTFPSSECSQNEKAGRKVEMSLKTI